MGFRIFHQDPRRTTSATKRGEVGICTDTDTCDTAGSNVSLCWSIIHKKLGGMIQIMYSQQLTNMYVGSRKRSNAEETISGLVEHSLISPYRRDVCFTNVCKCLLTSDHPKKKKNVYKNFEGSAINFYI